MKRVISKPSYSAEEREAAVEKLCAEIAKGRALSSICANDRATPGYSTVMRWLSESADLKEKIERAREDGATKLLEEIVEISDQSNGDAYIDYKDDKPYARIDGDAIQRAKLRVYAREKYAAMIAPRKFGAKLDVTSAGKALPAPVTHNDNRIQALLTIAAERMAQRALPAPIDATPVDDTLDDIFS